MDSKMTDALMTLSGFGNQKMAEVGLASFVMLMGIMFICTVYISILYINFFDARNTGSQVHKSFPLVGLSVTAIFISIQFSLPLSLGLIGALSIVRFRTPIKEPEEIGFIMLVIAAALCCATFNLLFLAILLVIATIALLFMRIARRLFKGRVNDGILMIRAPRKLFQDTGDELIAWLKKKFPFGKIDSINESDDEVVIHYSFRKGEEKTLLSLSRKMAEKSPAITCNVFFNRVLDI